MRLQRYLAACGIASRRASENLIRQGRVTVNGTLAGIGCDIDPERDTVCVNGEPVRREKPVYILFNKPAGVVTTVQDTHDRKTVMDYFRSLEARVFPVGRLDLDVGGVLLLTNDGELAQRLTHPRYEIPKTYVATVKGRVGDDALRKLEAGVPLADGPTAPMRAEVLSRKKDTSRLRLTLHEGRKREVKRMCQAVGHEVRRLRRVQFAGLETGSLRPGQWRWLRREEVARLRRLVKLR